MYDTDKEACVIPGSLSDYPRPSVSSNIQASSQYPGISVSSNIQASPQYPGTSLSSTVQLSPRYSQSSKVEASPQYPPLSLSADMGLAARSSTLAQAAFRITSSETSHHCGISSMLAQGPRNRTISPSMTASDEVEVRPRKLYLCDACDTTFTSTSGLKNHKKQVHLNKWKFECHICQKKFMFKEHYEGHMNMHFNIKAFKCPNCPKKFAYKTGVSLHLRNGSCENKRKDSQDEHVETPWLHILPSHGDPYSSLVLAAYVIMYKHCIAMKSQYLALCWLCDVSDSQQHLIITVMA